MGKVLFNRKGIEGNPQQSSAFFSHNSCIFVIFYRLSNKTTQTIWQSIGTSDKSPHTYPMAPAFQFPKGFRLLPEFFDRAAQESLLEKVREGIREAPLYRPVMPKTGQPLSVRMSNFGPLGWITSKSGYRYGETHPATGKPWPVLPEVLQKLWRDVAHWPTASQACLINYYDQNARLGLHVDADENAANAPIVSVSLGDQALYRLGGPKRSDPTRSLRLSSGDVVVLAGKARHCYHGVDRIYPNTSTLLPKGGRINLTLRVVR
jgi:DNA oxidative demethylase